MQQTGGLFYPLTNPFFIHKKTGSIIPISGTDKLDDTANDWLIISKTAIQIKLKDDNTSKNEQLHFTKM
jgi:hypothetical protein